MTSGLHRRTAARTFPATRARRLAWLTLAIGFLIGAAAVIGFGPTLDERLLRPSSPRPAILYVHAVLMAAWITLTIVQIALVFTGRVALHRRLGAPGLLMGAAVPVVGVWTTLAMARFHGAAGVDQAAFIVVSLFDMAVFALAFGLAAALRSRPAVHGRLMVIAACGLAVPAFARLPGVPDNSWYIWVDLLIVAAAFRDRIVLGRIHPVYRYAIPMLAAAQACVMGIYLSAAPAWTAVARVLIYGP